MKLLMCSSEKVTVHPSSTSMPTSAWITWPLSTNKVTWTIHCTNYHPKITFKTSDGVSIGMMEMRSYSTDLVVHCKEGGNKDWWGGNHLTFSTWSWGICSSGTTETLTIERSTVALQILRGAVVVFHRNWAVNDGRCSLEAGFWRLENFGTTVVSAESVLGIVNL